MQPTPHYRELLNCEPSGLASHGLLQQAMIGGDQQHLAHLPAGAFINGNAMLLSNQGAPTGGEGGGRSTLQLALASSRRGGVRAQVAAPHLARPY